MWCRCSRCLTTESSKESKGENHKARKRARGGQPLWLRIYEFLPRDLPICSFCVLYQSNDVDIRSITFNRPPLQILPATLNAAVAICSQRGLLLQLSFGETVFFPYLDFSSAFCVVCQTCCTLFFSIHLLSLRLQQCRLPLSSLLCRRLCCRRSGRQHTQRAAQPAAQPFAQRLVRPEGGERRLAAKMTAELCPRAGYSARRTAGCTNTAGCTAFCILPAARSWLHSWARKWLFFTAERFQAVELRSLPRSFTARCPMLHESFLLLWSKV